MALRKYLYALVAAATLGLTACDDYDDGALWDAVNDHESRLEALEQWQEQVNGNIAALQQLLSTTDYITNVTPVMEDGRQVGYTIEFLNQSPITIYNGDKGDDGAPGQNGHDGHDGKPGNDGEPGNDGQTPEIGLVKGDDGNWYWTVNGELMLDDAGNPIRANGHDGTDGQPGEDGQPGKPGDDAQTPQIALGGTLTGGTYYGIDGKQESSPAAGAWYLSVDGGKTWHRISGDKGQTGDTGPGGEQGGQGDKGGQGDAWLACAPEISEDGRYYIFTLSDGDNTDLSDNPTFKVPVYQGFSLGTGTLTLVSGKAEIEITPPAGTTVGDYQAMMAEITPEDAGDSDISTRAAGNNQGWSAKPDLENMKVTVTRQTSGNGTKALLSVTLLRNDGSEITASRMVNVPDYEIVDGTYIVYSADGLYAWAEAVNKTTYPFPDCTLGNDITMPDVPEGGSNWTPVGNSYSYNYHGGTFDGLGHTVSNVVINGGDNVGFFGSALDVTIKGLNLADSKINGNNNVGGIVGLTQDVNITACSVTGCTINGVGYLGGIVGHTDVVSYITACYVTGGMINGSNDVGGIVGYAQGCVITSCYTTADVKGNSNTGSFVGYWYGFNIFAGYWQTDTQTNAIGYNEYGGDKTTKVEGDVTWKTATDAMNAKIPNDGSCPYRYVQRDGDNNPPVLEYTGE